MFRTTRSGGESESRKRRGSSGIMAIGGLNSAAQCNATIYVEGARQALLITQYTYGYQKEKWDTVGGTILNVKLKH